MTSPLAYDCFHYFKSDAVLGLDTALRAYSTGELRPEAAKPGFDTAGGLLNRRFGSPPRHAYIYSLIHWNTETARELLHAIAKNQRTTEK